MKRMNGLFIAAEILSKVGNFPFTNQPIFNVKKFKKLNNLSFRNDIPSFDETKNHVLINKIQVPIGTIIKRPLDTFLYNKFAFNIEYHYAVVLGTCIDGKDYLIEMTSGYDLRIITKEKFISKHNERNSELYFLPKANIDRATILERARMLEYESYDLIDLNCKIVSHHLVFGTVLPKTKNKLKEVQINLCDFRIGIYKLNLSDPCNSRNSYFLKACLAEAQSDKDRLIASIKSR